MEQLGDTDSPFEHILHGITDSVLLISKDLKILWANKAFINQTGYAPEEIIGKHCFAITHRNENPCVSPDDLCPVTESVKTGKAATTTHTHYDKEGNKIFVEVSAYPIRDINGEIVRFAYILRDITEKMRVAEDLRNIITESRKQQAEMEALLEGTRAILEYHDFHGAARSIFNSCKKLIGATSGYIALLNKDGTENEVLFLDSGGFPCSVDPNLPMPIRGLRAEAYHKVKTVYHNDFSRSEWIEFMPEGHVQLENVLFAPLVVEGRTVGLLGIANKRGGFTTYDAHMASSFAGLAAIALVNKRAEEEVRTAREELEKHVEERTRELAEANKDLLTQIIERKQAESRISATNAILELYIRQSSRKEYLDSVIELIRDWSKCYCVGIRVLNTYGNIPFESFVGYSKEFWDSENWLSVQKDQCACIRVIQGKPELQDLPAMTPGGSFRLNNANEFFSTLSEEEMGRFRGVCLQSGFKSIAIIPIRYRESVIGAIHVADEKEGMVPLKTMEFIESISPLIGEAVHRFSTEEELMKYQYHLEEMVEERTGMLKAATGKLQQEIAERKIAAEGLETRVKERTSELEEANIELRRLSAHLQSVREEERTNIARDIHDDLGQALTALKIEVSMLANKLRPDNKFLDKAESIIKKIDDSIQSVKKICTELRPAILDHFGLSAAIEWNIEQFENQTGIKCDVSLEPREIILDQDLTISIFRIFQEALTNVVRHADASAVWINLRLRDGKIMLEIKDNGKGIAKKHFLDSQSFGIMGIKERVNFFGGNVKISSIKDKGTTIMVLIPLRKKDGP